MKVIVRHALTDETREFILPKDGPYLLAALIEWIPDLGTSRRMEGFRGSLERAMQGGGTPGYVGPYLEIRRVDGAGTVTEIHGSPITVLGEVVRQRVVEDPTDPNGHEPDCTCLFCIPGA